MIIPYENKSPKLGAQVFVAPGAWVIGETFLGDNVSVFYGAVVRGDILPIRIGKETNIQDHALVHTSHGRMPVVIGEQVTIGHRAIIHGCQIGNLSLIGMGAIILDDTVIEEECLVGAGTLVTEGKRIPRRSLVLGSPGKVIRTIDEDELKYLRTSAASYVETAKNYLKHFQPQGSGEKQ